MKHLLDSSKLEPVEIENILDLTDEIKETEQKPMKNKTLVMLFEKPSTRTRVSFETAMTQLGGHAINLTSQQSQISRGEPLKDVAKALSRYGDAIMARLHDHSDLEKVKKHSEVPVINGLTDLLHPCQALADLYTIKEDSNEDLQNLKLSFVGDGNNVAHSLMQASAITGIDFSIATPKGYGPKDEIIQKSKEISQKSDSTIEITDDPEKALAGSDYVYTDVIVSMGQNIEKEQKLKDFSGYQLTEKLMSLSDDAKFMHCMPVNRGEEAEADVVNGESSIIYKQAENRLHVQKAIIMQLKT